MILFLLFLCDEFFSFSVIITNITEWGEIYYFAGFVQEIDNWFVLIIITSNFFYPNFKNFFIYPFTIKYFSDFSIEFFVHSCVFLFLNWFQIGQALKHICRTIYNIKKEAWKELFYELSIILSAIDVSHDLVDNKQTLQINWRLLLVIF